MRSILKRRLIILPLAVLASAAVAACGSSSNSGASGSTAKSTSASASGGYGGGYGASSSTKTSTSASSAGASSAGTVSLASTSKGKILVNSKGFTMYLFTADKQGKDRCATTSGCLAVWPALTVTGHPTAGTGVNKAMLGTIKLSNGTQQVTYAGHPLYGYTGDGSPDSTGYIGITSFGGTWYAVNAAGGAVH